MNTWRDWRPHIEDNGPETMKFEWSKRDAVHAVLRKMKVGSSVLIPAELRNAAYHEARDMKKRIALAEAAHRSGFVTYYRLTVIGGNQ